MALDIEDILWLGLLLGLGALVAGNAASSPTDTGGSILQPITNLAVRAISRFIATSEGFYISGSLPSRAHNPGDLEIGNVGYGTINNKTVFASDDDGFAALDTQVERMLGLHGTSLYSPDMTISHVANEWVNGKKTPSTDSNSWATNFSTAAGVTPDTTLGDVAAMHS